MAPGPPKLGGWPNLSLINVAPRAIWVLKLKWLRMNHKVLWVYKPVHTIFYPSNALIGLTRATKYAILHFFHHFSMAQQIWMIFIKNVTLKIKSRINFTLAKM